jgi:hypothetical protein
MPHHFISFFFPDNWILNLISWFLNLHEILGNNDCV